MARKRMLHAGIWESKQFSKLSDKAKITYLGMITLGDLVGRFKADPALIRAKIWPRNDPSLKDVEIWLKEIYDSGDEDRDPLVIPYKSKGEFYALHPNWSQYQVLRSDREKIECPDPSDEIMKKYCHQKSDQLKPIEKEVSAPQQKCGEPAAQVKLSKAKSSEVKLSKVSLPEFQKFFKKILIDSDLCDAGYADKTAEQIGYCKKEDIEKIKQKTSVMTNCLRSGDVRIRRKASVIFHEIAGLVNDSQQQILSGN